MTVDRKFSIGTVTRFYVPLMIQAFAQSLTYPLVAGIVSHGQFGVDALAAFSQGLSILFMVGALGGGLVTTGMVFARTRYGYKSFVQLNTTMMTILLLLECVPAIPPLDRYVFEGFFALPPHLARVARDMLLFGTAMNAGFFLRNVPMVLLFNNYESSKANNATLLRVVFTLGCSAVFPRFDWVGPYWGLLALTAGVWVEYFVTLAYGRKFAAAFATEGALPTACEVLSLTWEQFHFTLPLSLGGFLLATTPLICAAFIVRTANAADMLAIHYITLGVANPVCFMALRMQTVAVKFLPEYPGDRRLLYYAILTGLIVGAVSLVFTMPWFAELYFWRYQNLPPRLHGIARLVIAIYALLPMVHAVRGRIEGIASARRCPSAVMAGQIAYSAAILAVCAILLPLGVAGWAMAVSSIVIAPLCTIAAVYSVLAFHAKR